MNRGSKTRIKSRYEVHNSNTKWRFHNKAIPKISSKLTDSISKLKSHQIDRLFLGVIICLLMFGLVMVVSVSSESARFLNNDPYYFAKRQAIWAVISIIAMIFVSKIDYRKIQDKSLWILGMSVLFLVGVLIVGKTVNGGKRWIDLGFISFQPSEFAKLALIIFLANSLSKNRDKLGDFKTGLLPHLAVVGVIASLIILEPHFSATFLILITCMAMICVAGAKIKHLLLLATPIIAGGVCLIAMSPYRVQRVLSFLDPFKDKLGDGYQVIQSLYAIGSGGLFGLGLGKSRQKFLYIPEPHNDFIFSILCEELGWIGAIFMISLFIILIWWGISIAMRAPDRFSCLFIFGMMTLIAVETIINISVVTSSMPVTGMPLPFFSYGGTSLLFLMIGMGIILNISRYTTRSGN